MKRKIVVIVILVLIMCCTKTAYANTLDEAIDKVPVHDLEEYINKGSSYFKDNNIEIKDLIKKAFKGELDISLKDYIRYELENQQDFYKDLLKTGMNVIAICMLLTIIKYFADEINNQSVSDIVVLFSVIIIFTIILKDVLSIKDMLKSDFASFKTITEEINAVFMAAMLTFGKLSMLQFFQTSLNYVIGITTQFVYSFTDIVTVIMIAVILVNNMSKLINMKLFYGALKKVTLLILSGYMIIVVINFSVQGYILYKTDNIFISSIKALSPSAVPVIGSAVTNFFGVFLKSILMIKDVLGVIVIVFLLSAFGGSLVKIVLALVLYKAVGVLTEPFNENISKLIYEMADLFYIYLICLITPIIIVTVYYSILLNYMNNIFG
jgi:stage III sporulation protein AE